MIHDYENTIAFARKEEYVKGRDDKCDSEFRNAREDRCLCPVTFRRRWR